MKRTNFHPIRLISFLVPILFVAIACNYLSGDKGLPSEQNTKSPANTTDDVSIWLNDENIGSIDDVSELQKKVGKIQKDRENRGIFAEGSNIVKNQVYLIIDSNLSLKNVARVQGAIGGSINIPNSSLAKLDGDRDPLLLVVRVQDSAASPPEIPNYPAFRRHGDKGYIDLLISAVNKTESDKEIKDSLYYERISKNSLEINGSGEYFINEKYDQSALDQNGADIYDFPIKQRRIKKNDLKAELLKITGENGLEIIANENLGYETIKEIINITGELESGYHVELIPGK
ncbi:MAG: hypothetical protein OEM82_01410 [Acidobacteriota bacterium]|nr:hypothetical protein [Acidobacteriota bacterium]MDH3528098.1 hypothetical protein [Acidobacteriota bacterium]